MWARDEEGLFASAVEQEQRRKVFVNRGVLKALGDSQGNMGDNGSNSRTRNIVSKVRDGNEIPQVGGRLELSISKSVATKMCRSGLLSVLLCAFTTYRPAVAEGPTPPTILIATTGNIDWKQVLTVYTAAQGETLKR